MGFLTGNAVAVVVQQLPPVLVLLVAALTCAPLCAGITVAPPSPKGDVLANATTNIAGGSNRTVALLTNEADITASSSSGSATALNQTERFRRLIPYMTFYVPGGGSHAPTSNGDYLPVNQAYSYAPATQQNQQAKTVPVHPQQELQQQQQQPLTADEIDLQAPHILQQPHQRPHSGGHHNAQQQQQHQNAPPVRASYPYNGNNQHAHPLASSKAHGPQVVYTVRQQPQQQHQQPHSQHATIVYKTRHQANKPHKPYAPPPSNQQQQQQPHQQTDANGQQLPAQQPQSQRINYSYQYLPQSPAVIPKKKLTPFLSTNQIPGEFRPVQQQLAEFHQQQLLLQQQQQQQQSYAEYEPEDGPSEGHNPSDNGAQHYQQQAQQQHQPQQNHPENAYASYGPSSTPPSYVQFIKAIAPRPTTDSPPPIPAEAMPLLQSPHLMVPPPMSHQAYGSPSDHAANIGYNSGADNPDKVFYNGFDYGYTLDPDDGYDRRVPVATPARPSPVIAKGKYGGFSYRTTTAVPFVASPTPFRPRPEPIVQQYAYGQKLPATSRPTVTTQHNSEPSPPPPELSFDHKPTQRPFEHQPLSYEHVRAQKRPGSASQRPTPVPALDVRQHLTETTHVDTAAQRPLAASHPVHQYHAQVPSVVRPYHSHRVPPQRLQLETSTAATPSQVLPTRIIVPDEPGTSGEYEEPHYPIREPNQHLGAYAGDESPPAPSNYADVLHKLQQSNLLPQRLNDGNIDVSIQSLVGILNALKQRQQQQHQLEPQQRRPVGPPAQFANEVQGQHEVVYAQQPAVAVHRPAAEVLSRRPAYKRPTLRVTTTAKPSVEDTGDYDYNGGEDTRSSEDPHAEAGPPGPNTGRPGIDYPALSEIPPTAFNCKEQRYKGFFGDPETNCQVWHYCDLNGGQASFLCPNGTIFSQVALTCDWWFNVKCSTTTQLYVLNERLYKYILPFSPKFPEDYSGPVVDKYLAMKYAEMEEKMRREKAKNKHTHSEDGEHNENDIDAPASSTEYGQDTAVQSAGLQATTVDGTLIDEEGQSHNVDSAIQYAAEGDTVRQHPQQTRPHFGHLRMPPAARLVAAEDVSFVHRTTTVNLEDVEQSTGLPDDAGGKSSSTSSEEPLRMTMEPPLREVKPSGGTVEVESERVELIEIKSDGSTGHLTPVGYR